MYRKAVLLLFIIIPFLGKGEFFIPSDSIEQLPAVTVFSWKNKKDFRKFKRMVYNLKKVYPYSQAAKSKLQELDERYNSFGTNKERKKYIKQLEKELLAEFDAPLRKLTISQGKMLIKLIDREAGKTSYTVLKEFKGGFSAFLWQGVARIFGHNLKSEYDKEGEDKLLEELVIMCENGTFDEVYYSIFAK